MDISIDKNFLPKEIQDKLSDDVVMETFYGDVDPMLIDAFGNPIQRDIDNMRAEYAIRKSVSEMKVTKPKRKKKKHSVIDELKSL